MGKVICAWRASSTPLRYWNPEEGSGGAALPSVEILARRAQWSRASFRLLRPSAWVGVRSMPTSRFRGCRQAGPSLPLLVLAGLRPWLAASYTASRQFVECNNYGMVQEPGVAEEFCPARARHLMRRILSNNFTAGVNEKAEGEESPPLPAWLTEADLDYFVAAFEKTGFTGGINYYRNIDRNWELMAPWADAKVQVPTTFIVGDGDLTYHYAGIQDYLHKGGFKADVPLLEEVVVIPGAGHFIQQEKAKEVSDIIYNFVAKFTPQAN
ncbi:hypothetical protein GUJ93_ZPchr0003g16895 [Zizania palustris]|uniref:AB hydrolase-1 domain-containing protein n=1 Tax=Zizania palustris TaxID=103762 RepID=A0A8J5VD86_ZIZPA|nr:hypothetical protein GUJ93_ZPchr0003g16895 [Zizania palustris]